MVELECKAVDGQIRVDGDELVFSQGGRIARALSGPVVSRIPIACIRDVVFKDSKLSGGFISLVVGDDETPKASLWAVAERPWTLQFRYGKRTQSFRDLRDHLVACIEQNHAAGVNPVTARQPYLDPAGAEEFDALKQNVIGDTFVVQPAPGCSVEVVIEAANQHRAYSGSGPISTHFPHG